MAVRVAALHAALACALAAVALPRPACAQHVVTDAEAGKLTLDALTATPRPAVRHVAYHPGRAAWGPSGRYRSVAMLHLASYRHPARPAGHPAASRHRRRG